MHLRAIRLFAVVYFWRLCLVFLALFLFHSLLDEFICYCFAFTASVSSWKTKKEKLWCLHCIAWFCSRNLYIRLGKEVEEYRRRLVVMGGMTREKIFNCFNSFLSISKISLGNFDTYKSWESPVHLRTFCYCKIFRNIVVYQNYVWKLSKIILRINPEF